MSRHYRSKRKITGIEKAVLALLVVLLVLWAEPSEKLLKKYQSNKPEPGAPGEVMDVGGEIEKGLPDEGAPDLGNYTFSVPEYDGVHAYYVINDDISFITDDMLTTEVYANYPELDSLGRCGTVTACVSEETVAEGERGSIGMFKPSGWHTVRYDDLIEDRYLYHRSHLGQWKLLGDDSNNERNLVTGTQYMNVEGMNKGYEEVLDQYIYDHPKEHVIIRVTPIFDGYELVCRGVLMEARSVETDGLNLCRYAPNVQPGIEIDYLTGLSRRAE